MRFGRRQVYRDARNLDRHAHRATLLRMLARNSHRSSQKGPGSDQVTFWVEFALSGRCLSPFVSGHRAGPSIWGQARSLTPKITHQRQLHERASPRIDSSVRNAGQRVATIKSRNVVPTVRPDIERISIKAQDYLSASCSQSGQALVAFMARIVAFSKPRATAPLMRLLNAKTPLAV